MDVKPVKFESLQRMEYPELSSHRSASIVQYLKKQRKMKLREIKELTGLSESYLSRISRGERNFRLDHLVSLERALGKPLPILLIEASYPSAKNKELQKALDILKEALKNSAQLRAEYIKQQIATE